MRPGLEVVGCEKKSEAEEVRSERGVKFVLMPGWAWEEIEVGVELDLGVVRGLVCICFVVASTAQCETGRPPRRMCRVPK